ncbi:hypothetical protein CANARDRAFT_6337 [[Candida] arabinofermentans NRRL YB-2248]|uniref:Uncharacterized protein n=1 Tax=[Candida] arabinofermentans NRRL YB-2248 TaxID=983967 RepID=A0A1E4T4R9_9ASCO|nr:hypothetical protein CANARDRAFT_6337 [[Candida] arabinofermentans NRRL YB-2248]
MYQEQLQQIESWVSQIEKAASTSKEVTDNNKTDRGSFIEDPEEEDGEDRAKLSEDAKSKDVNEIDAERDDDEVDEAEKDDDHEEMVDAQEGINDDDDDDDDNDDDDDEADDD